PSAGSGPRRPAPPGRPAPRPTPWPGRRRRERGGGTAWKHHPNWSTDVFCLFRFGGVAGVLEVNAHSGVAPSVAKGVNDRNAAWSRRRREYRRRRTLPTTLRSRGRWYGPLVAGRRGRRGRGRGAGPGSGLQLSPGGHRAGAGGHELDGRRSDAGRRPPGRSARRPPGGHPGGAAAVEPRAAPPAGEAGRPPAHRVVRPGAGPAGQGPRRGHRPGRVGGGRTDRTAPGRGRLRPGGRLGPARRPRRPGGPARSDGRRRRRGGRSRPGRRRRRGVRAALSAVHQLLPVFAGGDAIGHHVLHTQRVLRQAGFDSEIYVEEAHPAVRRHARHYRELRPEPGDRLLYHLSTGSPMAAYLAEQDHPVLVYYHNITPASFFARWEPVAAANVARAREELRKLASVTRLAMANSEYSARELRDEGYAEAVVVPVMVDFADLDAEPDAVATTRLRRAAE